MPTSIRRRVIQFAPALLMIAIPLTAMAAGAGEAAGAAEGAHDGASHMGEVLSPAQKGLVTAITTVIVFLGLVVVLGKFAFGPIAAGLKAREDKIRKDIADAEAARSKADATLRELTDRLNKAEAEARAIMARATTDAEKIATTIKARAQQDAEEVRERALKEIETAKVNAIAEVHEHAVTLSTSIAEKILKRSINAADQQDLVRSSLDQLAGAGHN